MAPRSTTAAESAPAAPPVGVLKKKASPEPASPRAGWNPMSLTWSEAYNQDLEKAWARLPGVFRKVLVTLAVFSMGLAMSGDWIVILVHLRRSIGLDADSKPTLTGTLSDVTNVYFKEFTYFWVASNIVSYGLYFTVGGFLHWYFYVRQRDKTADWKLQPNSFLSVEDELHEIKIGTLSLLVTGTFSAILSCYIYNGGWSMVYHRWDEYGVLWFFLQWPAIFLYQDYVTYLLHRMYHTPWLYKNFHKLHHRYKHPTAFSVTAIHPVEVLHIQMTLCLPLFAFPVHWGPFYVIALYTYYHGIIDHSGIDFKAQWWQPWQPDAIFHDNHHQYFHVNFGFNCWMWDKLHGTYRRKDKIYTEDTFYGRGKALSEATAEELAQDLKERSVENPKAYRSGTSDYLLSAEELKSIKKQ